MYPIGNYTARLFLKVNGKIYGEEINKNIIIIKKMENLEKNNGKIKVKEFRDLYLLPLDKYSDEKLLDILIIYGFNFDKLFSSLIDNK